VILYERDLSFQTDTVSGMSVNWLAHQVAQQWTQEDLNAKFGKVPLPLPPTSEQLDV
jgi:hypothetical protein